jgi:prepilin-type N-terminal cleavage/methylation domain-containing protein
MRFFKKKQNLQTNRGFTLVEMAVVTAIFAVLTTIVMVRYGDFTSNMLVTNMAYEIALELRQAQVFGLGSRGYDNPTGNTEFSRPYGVFINLSDSAPKQADRVYFFVDLNANSAPGYGQCNATNGSGICSCINDECLSQKPLQRNIRITEIRTDTTDNDGTCEADNVDQLAITFKRPSPEAHIERQATNRDDYTFAQIKVEAPASGVKPSYVLVRKTGQISVSDKDICVINN